MKKTMMYLPEDMHAYLVREAAQRGVSMAEIAREAIAQYRTENEGDPQVDVSGLIGLIDETGPQTNDAEQVDELLSDYYARDNKWDQEHGLAGDS